MDNVTSLSARRKLPAAATQQSSNTVTLQRALQDGISAGQLRAVADWNERESSKSRYRRSVRDRFSAQAVALRVTATNLEASGNTLRAA